jgi:hypothetical protein
MSPVRLLVCVLSLFGLAACDATEPPIEFSIGPQGGTLTFAAGAVVLTFPAGAVSQSTVFTVVQTTTYPPDPTVLGPAVYEIGPTGTTFAQPVSLRVSFSGITLPPGVQKSDLAVYKVVSGAWQKNPTSVVDTVAGTLTASITSLSTYGVLGAGGQVPLQLLGACDPYTAPAVPAPLRTLYVDASTGNDNANGLTAQTAWKTLAKANLAAQPGDLFLLKGTFQDEYIHPAQSGTASQKITYRRAPGATATILVGRFDVAVDLTQLQHIVIDGLELAQVIEPFRLFESHFNWLRNLNIHDAGGSNLRLNSTDNRVEDSQFLRIGNEAQNTGDAVYLSNGSDRNFILRNNFGPAGHGGIWISHQSASDLQASDNIVAHNRVVNPWANGIGLNGTANRTLLECNFIAATANGTGPNYKRYGLEVEGTANTVRYNIIFTTGDGGISLEGWTFNGKAQNSIGNHIYNNTVWSTGGAGLRIVQKEQNLVESNVVENNIFWGNAGGEDAGVRYSIFVDEFNANAENVWPAGTIGNNIVRNNIFEATLQFMVITRTPAVGGHLYFSAPSQATFPNWGTNLRVNPLLTNPGQGDFSLAIGSPAVNAGLVISSPPPYRAHLGTAPDLGAIEAR